jgi:hypothetical protein
MSRLHGAPPDTAARLAAPLHATKRCLLPGVAHHMGTGGDGRVESAVFVVAGQRWQVVLQCPVSSSSSSEGFVSLLLIAAGGNRGHTRCRMQLINHVSPGTVYPQWFCAQYTRNAANPDLLLCSWTRNARSR